MEFRALDSMREKGRPRSLKMSEPEYLDSESMKYIKRHTRDWILSVPESIYFLLQ